MKNDINIEMPEYIREIAEYLYDKFGVEAFPEPRHMQDAVESAVYFLASINGWLSQHGDMEDANKVRKMCEELYRIDSKYWEIEA